MVEQVVESETLAIEKYLDPGFGIIVPHARKAFSSVAQNYNEYQKKILAALDEHGVSDTTFYTDVPEQCAAEPRNLEEIRESHRSPVRRTSTHKGSVMGAWPLLSFREPVQGILKLC